MGETSLPRSPKHTGTRHTFAIQWVLAGGSILRRAKILGHSGVDVSELYAHPLPDSFCESEFAMLSTDLVADGEEVHIKSPSAENGAIGYAGTRS